MATPLLEALRTRSSVPRLDGWTLHTAGEPPYPVRPDDHDPVARRDRETPGTQVLVSLSTPLGIEAMPAVEATPLLDAWHAGAVDLPAGYRAWAAVSEVDPDLDALAKLLATDFVGLQVSATTWATPELLESHAAVLRVCEELDRPVLVHPGPTGTGATAGPGWWPAVVDYPAQLQAAWWTWHTAGRALLPDLRVCFAAGAGLAPLHHERFAVRGGQRFVVDPDVFVDISSYGRQAVDALARALGIDVLVMGSDRPYAEPPDPCLGDAAHRAITVTNPRRLLDGSTMEGRS
ncbi:amidohydrolase [Jatrophihabitans sp. YIM 134969]